MLNKNINFLFFTTFLWGQIFPLGKFANYAGADGIAGSTWFHDARSWIELEVLKQIGPDIPFMQSFYPHEFRRVDCRLEKGHYSRSGGGKCFIDGSFPWTGSRFSKLLTDLEKVTDPKILSSQVLIDTNSVNLEYDFEGKPIIKPSSLWIKNAFAGGAGNPPRECKISVGTLKSYAESARIVVNENVITPEKFLGVQNEEPEHRNVEFHQGVAICHSQKIMFFVEEHKIDGDDKAYNILRRGDLSKTRPIILLSAAGINFRIFKGWTDDKIRESIGHLWEAVLASAIWQVMLERKVTGKADEKIKIYMPAIGMGDFFRELTDDRKKQLATMYFEGLFAAFKKMYAGKFISNIYFNPAGYATQLNAVIDENKDLKDFIVNFSFDVNLAAVERSKEGLMTAVLNPSAQHVLEGRCDIGNHRRTAGGVAEEFQAAVSTAFIGSRYMAPGAWTTRERVKSIAEIGDLVLERYGLHGYIDPVPARAYAPGGGGGGGGSDAPDAREEWAHYYGPGRAAADDRGGYPRGRSADARRGGGGGRGRSFSPVPKLKLQYGSIPYCCEALEGLNAELKNGLRIPGYTVGCMSQTYSSATNRCQYGSHEKPIGPEASVECSRAFLDGADKCKSYHCFGTAAVSGQKAKIPYCCNALEGLKAELENGLRIPGGEVGCVSRTYSSATNSCQYGSHAQPSNLNAPVACSIEPCQHEHRTKPFWPDAGRRTPSPRGPGRAGGGGLGGVFAGWFAGGAAHGGRGDGRRSPRPYRLLTPQRPAPGRLFCCSFLSGRCESKRLLADGCFYGAHKIPSYQNKSVACSSTGFDGVRRCMLNHYTQPWSSFPPPAGGGGGGGGEWAK